MTLLIIFLILTVGFSFLCSILESVMMSTPISYLTMLEEEGSKFATKALSFKENSEKPLAAILSLNTIANTLGAAAIGRQASMLFGDAVFGIISVIVTVMILVFSEIIPKTLGTYHWKSLIGFATAVIAFLIIVLYPVVWFVQLIGKIITPKDHDEARISREEVSAMANVAEEDGVFEENENKVIQNFINLDDVTVADAMTPRVVAAIAKESMSVREFYKDNSLLHHSRIPVYKDSRDYITGYVLRSEVVACMAEDRFNVHLSDLRRDIPYYHQDAPLSEIWDSFLQHKEQISAIIDDYGCFMGILSLEDVIETILGSEIVDEDDVVRDMQQYARDRWQSRQSHKLSSLAGYAGDAEVPASDTPKVKDTAEEVSPAKEK